MLVECLLIPRRIAAWPALRVVYCKQNQHINKIKLNQFTQRLSCRRT